jgi:hypothetical protein
MFDFVPLARARCIVIDEHHYSQFYRRPPRWTIGGQYLDNIEPATAKPSSQVADRMHATPTLRLRRSLLRQTINLDQTYSGAAILAAHSRRVVTSWKRDKNR